MPLIWLVSVIILGIAAYSVAPIFGLDALYPQFFNDSALNWQAAIVALVLICLPLVMTRKAFV